MSISERRVCRAIGQPRSTNAAAADPWKKIQSYNVTLNIAGNNEYFVAFDFEGGSNEQVEIKNLDVLNTVLGLLSKKGAKCEWASASKILHVTGL